MKKCLKKKKLSKVAKKYSVSERKNYHRSRAFEPSKFGLTFGSPKHRYSQGFYDGCLGLPSSEYKLRVLEGEKDAFSYGKGYQVGKKM